MKKRISHKKEHLQEAHHHKAPGAAPGMKGTADAAGFLLKAPGLLPAWNPLDYFPGAMFYANRLS